MAAYPNSNQRALMITIAASRLLILPTRANLCPTIQQLKACPGLVSGGFEGGSEVEADRSFRDAPIGGVEQHHLRRCDDVARLRSAEGQQVRERAGLDGACGCLRTTCHRADDQFYRGRRVLAQPSSGHHFSPRRLPG